MTHHVPSLAGAPGLDDLAAGRPSQWFNPSRGSLDEALATEAARSAGVTLAAVDEAAARLRRWAPWVERNFPATRATAGTIESPLVAVPAMQRALDAARGAVLGGRLWAKLDSHLPVSGSIKARGGIHEVLQYAEQVIVAEGAAPDVEAAAALDDGAIRRVLGGHGITVGSTGNLGLSIGITGAALGLATTVHMSAEARAWKKDRLRSLGVRVVEHADDYSVAVAQARAAAAADQGVHFVDDEHSASLLLGYAVAGRRLAGQLAALGQVVDARHPLVVHLPCGVGGGPGGVMLGLASVFGPAAHCLFAEPTHSPCLQLSLATGLGDRVQVADLGLDNRTLADGLAVGRSSGLVAPLAQVLVDGAFSLDDDQMLRHVARLHRSEGIDVEPSAAAGFDGPHRLLAAPASAREALGLDDEALAQATHVVWCTGGSMVPADEMARMVTAGERLLDADEAGPLTD